MIAAGGPRQGCNEQLDSRAMSYIDSIDLRRVWIADEETGLAFGISQFRHSMVDPTMPRAPATLNKRRSDKRPLRPSSSLTNEQTPVTKGALASRR